MLAGLEPLADAAPPDRAGPLLGDARADLTRRCPARAALWPRTSRGAVAIADRLGHDDLAVRCMTELALGRIWARRCARGDRAARRVRAPRRPRRRSDGSRSATLRAMVSALVGRHRGRLRRPRRARRRLRRRRDGRDAVGALHIALVPRDPRRRRGARRRILELAAAFVPDRFTGYAVAAMRYRQAQRAHGPRRPARRADAVRRLRHAPPSRRRPVGGRPAWPTSGWWRANHDDPGGLVDLANAALDLLEVWSSGRGARAGAPRGALARGSVGPTMPACWRPPPCTSPRAASARRPPTSSSWSGPVATWPTATAPARRRRGPRPPARPQPGGAVTTAARCPARSVRPSRSCTSVGRNGTRTTGAGATALGQAGEVLLLA